jgi:hypothetical protein
MNTKRKVLTLTVVCLLAVGAAGAASRGGGEGDISADRKKFAGEWDEVIAKYPHVALAYLNALEAAAAGAAGRPLSEEELSKVPALPQFIAAARAKRSGAPIRLTSAVARARYEGIKNSITECRKRCAISQANCRRSGRDSIKCSDDFNHCDGLCTMQGLKGMQDEDNGTPGQ